MWVGGGGISMVIGYRMLDWVRRMVLDRGL